MQNKEKRFIFASDLINNSIHIYNIKVMVQATSAVALSNITVVSSDKTIDEYVEKISDYSERIKELYRVVVLNPV